MRLPTIFAAAGLVCAACAQTSGTYQPATGQPVQWTIDSAHNLNWGGQLYIPEGVEVGPDSDALAGAKKSGFQDVLVDLPPDGAGWKETISRLETNGLRYVLSVDGLFPAAKGFAIEPEAYRIDNITGDRHVGFPLPGATSALTVLVTQRDATVQSYERVAVTGGQFSYDVKTKTDLDEVLLVYPEQSDAYHPDYWDQFDDRRDALLASLAECKPGPGLRGILNPLGRMFSSSVGGGLFVPESGYFRSELVSYLRTKYRSLNTCILAWGIGTNDFDSFDTLARLVPLWSGTRGVAKVWDTGSNVLYDCEDRHSQMWTDLETVIAAAASKRFERLILAVQTVANVPVLQDWVGWTAPFEATTGVLSGVGFKASGRSIDDVVESSSRPVSSVLRWKSPGWLVCTDFDLKDELDGASSYRETVDRMESMGVRGWYLKGAPAGIVAAAASDLSRRQSDSVAASVIPDTLYFPENALNPAKPERLPGGKWWLPSPEDGSRIDFGDGYFGYLTTDGTTYSTVIWTDGSTKTTRLRAANPKGVTLSRIDGLPVKEKVDKKGILVTIDSTPMVLRTSGEVPVPEECFNDTANWYAQLVSLADTQHKEIGEYALFLRDTVARFDRDPGGSLIDLRKRFWLLNRLVAPFSWIEAESSRDTNFSQIVAQSGCSDGAALLLQTPVTTDPKGFYADYALSSHATTDQEVWIAGRIPKELEKHVYVDVSGQRLNILDGPISTYGNGYGWYRLGTTRLLSTRSDMSVHVDSLEGAYLSIDLILLFPGTFRPNGIIMPDAAPFVKSSPKKGKRGK